jgi:hypothetical protein
LLGRSLTVAALKWTHYRKIALIDVPRTAAL